MPLAVEKDELDTFLRTVFPQVEADFTIDELRENHIIVRLNTAEKHLRPGGTVSGPSMFGLADVAAYLLVMAHVGKKELAVTTNCAIDFMRKPEAGKDLLCEGRLLKLGKALAVVETHLRSDGFAPVVARASLTYSIPPKV